MLFERLEYFIRHRVHIREVKTQDQVPSLLGCRVIENVTSDKHFSRIWNII